MLKNHFNKKAIKKCLLDLPSVLARDYGGGFEYSLGQVITGCRKLKIDDKYVHYAVVVFSDPEKVEEGFKQRYPDISYADTRKYLAAEFFDGNLNFIYKESRYSAVGNSGHDSMPGGTQPD